MWKTKVMCNYCKKHSHIKQDCYKLKRKQEQTLANTRKAETEDNDKDEEDPKNNPMAEQKQAIIRLLTTQEKYEILKMAEAEDGEEGGF